MRIAPRLGSSWADSGKPLYVHMRLLDVSVIVFHSMMVLAVFTNTLMTRYWVPRASRALRFRHRHPSSQYRFSHVDLSDVFFLFDWDVQQ